MDRDYRFQLHGPLYIGISKVFLPKHHSEVVWTQLALNRRSGVAHHGVVVRRRAVALQTRVQD